jgi:tRNA(Ile)-lysidine synthase
MRLRNIEPILRRALSGPCRVDRGERVLVAVSGGADSTALLLGLHRLRKEFGYDLAAAHLHHRLRGADADGDLAFVRDLCARLEVPLVGARWNTRARMAHRGLSGQDGLRRLRAEFLGAAARRLGALAIATAHTADDQLETLLLRIARGTGLAGLGGIAPRRRPWIRPLLAATRAQIEADLVAARQAWREDGSNADLGYARNRIRHQVIPALALAAHGRAGPAARSALAGKAVALSRDARVVGRWLARRARAALSAARVGSEGPGVALDCRRLSRLHPTFRGHVAAMAWESLSPQGELTRPIRRRLEALTGPRGKGRLDLPGGGIALREGDALRIQREPLGIEPVRGVTAPPLRLRVPSRRSLNGRRLEVKWTTGPQARRRIVSGGRGEQCFAAEGLEGRLELRAGRTDEWFVPFGRLRPQRLGDFLKRQGIPRTRRAGSLVLADRRGILWIVGVRRSARAALTPQTKKALWIHADLR